MANLQILLRQHVGAPCAPVVKAGDRVEKGQTLGIVEAMKLMNELESDYCGTVKQILVSNGEMVEYGQPLFIVEEQN